MTEPSITFNQTFDCIQREVIFDIAHRIYSGMGYDAPRGNLYYFERSQHPTEKAVWVMAEDIFEMFWGDSPDYDDDPEEGDRT